MKLRFTFTEINCVNNRLALLLLALIAGLDAIKVNCEFYVTSTETFGPLKSPYQCKAKTQNVQGLGSVDDVIGAHKAGKTNADTKLISIKQIKCDRLPKNFNKYFTNLEGIFAFSTGIKTVEKEDLSPFTKLRYIDMAFNNLNTLPSNLFEGNPDLEWIDFSDNKLRNIGVNLLESIPKLNYADFQSNRCVDFRAWDKNNLRELQLALRNIQCALNDA